MADFGQIKERVTIEAAAQMLGLNLRRSGNQLRSACEVCGTGGDRALVITPQKQLFYCFSAGIGGDLISLVGHLKQCSLADAGRHLADHFGIDKLTAPPAPVRAKEHGGGKQPAQFDPEAYAAKLVYSDEVKALGLSEEDATRLGIGYASTGMHRGRVVVPVRNMDGSIAGFVSATDLKVPTKWLTSNVVKLKRA